MPYNEKAAMVLGKLHAAMIARAKTDAHPESEQPFRPDDAEQVLLDVFSEQELERIRSVAWFCWAMLLEV